MSFNINLMLNTSDVNVVDKTVSILSTVSGTLKEQTSILTPTIKIQGSIPTSCNYFYISEFNRYYYITDISSITANVFEISGRVDVLKTYSSAIKGCTGIVARQQNNWNLYIDDGSFKTYQNDRVQLLSFPSGFTTEQFVIAISGA